MNGPNYEVTDLSNDYIDTSKRAYPNGRQLRRSAERSRRRGEKKIQQLVKVRKGFMN